MLIFVLNCSKPNEVKTIKTPIDGVSFTVETFYGHAAMDADITNVSAIFEQNGKRCKKLVLHGQNVTITNINWINEDKFLICVNGGIITILNSNVTLNAGGISKIIECRLQQPGSPG